LAVSEQLFINDEYRIIIITHECIYPDLERINSVTKKIV